MDSPRERSRRGRGGACPQKVRAVPQRPHGAHVDALRPRLLLALHRGLAQPEAGVPAVPLQLHDVQAGLRVPQRLLACCRPSDGLIVLLWPYRGWALATGTSNSVSSEV